MKKILITGANSYIGTSFENYVKEKFPNDYVVDTVDMIDGTWREKDFSSYDVVFHVAGIAHQKETNENAELYYKINRDFAVEAAEKAKTEGVGQFIFLSSMSVYGMDTGVITNETIPHPKSNYGKSKLQAEEQMNSLQGEYFKVTILRPPMVYGKGCKGNYQTLRKFALKLPFFPYVNNCRSMIYIENLCEFVRLVIENGVSGTFFPQNSEYTNTSEMARMIAEVHEKRIIIVKGFGWALKLMGYMTQMVNKAFGTLIYDMNMKIGEYEANYRTCGLEESIERTEI